MFIDQNNVKKAKMLLKSVLQDSVDDEIIRAAKECPALLFIEVIAKDLAMDLKGNRRTIQYCSPYVAIFGTGNTALLAIIKDNLDNYFKQNPGTQEIAMQQINKKFPNTSTDIDKNNRFDFPACTDAFTQFIRQLEAAINTDKTLKETGIPAQTTLDLLEQYRDFSTPGTVTSGYHYNRNNMKYVCQIYEDNRRTWKEHWNENQQAFFSQKVIGFEQRRMTKVQWKETLRGFANPSKPLPTDFMLDSYCDQSIVRNVAVLPFVQEDPTARIGDNCLVSEVPTLNCGETRLRRSAYLSSGYSSIVSDLENAMKRCSETFSNYVSESISANNVLIQSLNLN